MKATFEKQNFNEQAINKAYYVEMFAELGFEAQRVEISFKFLMSLSKAYLLASNKAESNKQFKSITVKFRILNSIGIN